MWFSFHSWLKGLAENKSTLGPEEVRKSALALVMGALDNPNPILRCAAGEALGRMAQVVGEATFIARMAQTSFDKQVFYLRILPVQGHLVNSGIITTSYRQGATGAVHFTVDHLCFQEDSNFHLWHLPVFIYIFILGFPWL